MLELGVQVTAVDISPDQLDAVKAKCAEHHERITICCEDIFDMLRSDTGKYDIIITNSFLHHIPDYLGLLRQFVPRLSVYGQFFSFEDLLIYFRLGKIQRLFYKTGYMAWRPGNAEVRGGVGRRWRWLRGVYRADSFHDTAEYPVLSENAVEVAIAQLFKVVGMACRIKKYYTTKSAFFQRMGTTLGYEHFFRFGLS